MVNILNNDKNLVLKSFTHYQVITNNVIFDTKDDIMFKIELFIDNVISNDKILVQPDYINQILYYNDYIDLVLILINNKLKNYITFIRNNFRLIIKRDEFSFSSLIKLLKTFFEKIKFFNNLIKSNNKILIENLELIDSYILFDSIIFSKLEKIMLEFNPKYKFDIKLLLNYIKEISNNDLNKLYNKFINSLKLSCKNFLLNFEYNNVPKNIKSVYILKNNLYYLEKIEKFFEINSSFDFINELILTNFSHILETNSIYEIEIIINNISNNLKKIINNYSLDNKNNIFNNIHNNILLLLDNINNNNIISCIKIIEFSYSIKNIYEEYFLKDKFNKLNITDESINNIFEYLNNLIINKKSNEIFNNINILSFFKNRDNIIYKYYEFLIKRLLSNYIENNNFNQFIIFEMRLADYVKLKFGNSYLYKISDIISNVDFSKDFYKNYQNSINNIYTNFNTLITSYESWNINQTEGVYDKNNLIIHNEEIDNYITSFTNYYQNNNPNKTLNWLFDYGEIEIIFNNQIIFMLPIQLIIFELINQGLMNSYESIINSNDLKKYNYYTRKNLINSMLISTIFIQENNIIKINNNLIKYKNLIEIYQNLSHNVNLFDEKNYIELCHNRDTIICTNINSLLKLKKYDYIQLFNEITKKIIQFEVTIELFDKAIKHLISNDYIICNNNLYEKIFY